MTAVIAFHRRPWSKQNCGAARAAPPGKSGRFIARRRGLPTSWLNDQATPKMPIAPDRRARTLYATEFLTVTGASGEHILGMRLESGRAFDQKDVVTLVRHLKSRTVEEWTAIHGRLYPHSRREDRAREMMETALMETDPGAPEQA